MILRHEGREFVLSIESLTCFQELSVKVNLNDFVQFHFEEDKASTEHDLY